MAKVSRFSKELKATIIGRARELRRQRMQYQEISKVLHAEGISDPRGVPIHSATLSNMLVSSCPEFRVKAAYKKGVPPVPYAPSESLAPVKHRAVEILLKHAELSLEDRLNLANELMTLPDNPGKKE